jgi:predicted nicotinamide N-methyase
MIRAAPFVPEIRLELGDAIVAMWQESAAKAPPYFAFPWVGGQAIARYVLDHPETVRNQRVLDVGTGSGLIAIAAARAGARSVAASDIDPRAIAAARANATLNDVELEVIERDVLDEHVDHDVILLGDVFYEQPLASRALAFIRRQHATVLVGDPGRAYFDPSGLELVAQYDVETSADLEGRTHRSVGVYRLT